MDVEALLWWQGVRESVGGALDWLAEALRLLGEPFVLLAAIAVLLWCVDKRAGQRMAIAFGASQLACQLLRVAACVISPWVCDARIHPLESALPTATGCSFPCGRTVNATLLCGGLAIKSRKRVWLAAILWALCALVGISRLYAGAHTPRDVMVALALGLLGLGLASALQGLLERKPRRDLPVMLTGVLASAAVAVYACVKPYPADMLGSRLPVDPAMIRLDCLKTAGGCVGFWLGWFWERRRVGYAVDGSPLRRIARGMVGLALTLVIYIPGGKLLKLAGAEFGAIATHLLATLFIVGAYPALFTRVEKRMDEPATKAM